MVMHGRVMGHIRGRVIIKPRFGPRNEWVPASG